MRIFLTGFMGSGKSAVGRPLAERLGVPFVDLDGEIEAAAGMSVPEIFVQSGEPAFRSLESRALRQTAAQPAVVVATGGGVVTREANLRWMARHGVTVWLHPEFATILRRIGERGGGGRPLFRDAEQARRLYASRLRAYRRADLEIPVGADEAPAETAAKIARALAEGAPAGRDPDPGGAS